MATKQHILYINADRGIPVWGDSGGSAHIRDFTAAAIEHGSAVTIVSARCQDADDSAPAAAVHKIKFRRYGASFHDHWLRCEKDEVAREIRSFYANTILSQQLPDLARKNDFSLVYERYSLFNFAGSNFARHQDLPYVLEVNSPLIDEALLHRQLYLRELADSVARHVFASADRIIAVSREVAQYVKSIVPHANVSVFPNAVNPSRFESFDINNSVADALSHLTGKFVVGYLGSLRPWHGLSNLIQAFATFAEQESVAHLLIIGDGKALRPELEKRCLDLGIQDRVTFTGEAPNAEVPQYLSYCDTVVAPYPALERFYFSPLKVFEYMASCKPIIASDIGQISELLSDNHTALLVKPGDVSELVAAMVRIRENPDLAETLGRRAYDLAREFHSWDVRMRQLMDSFLEIRSAHYIRQAV